MKNIVLYFVFLIALGGCKSEFVEVEPTNKAKVYFKVNVNSDENSKLATTVTRPMVANMNYTVYAFQKLTEDFVGSVSIDVGAASNASMSLDPNEEYIFIAVSNNAPKDVLASNVIFRSTYLHRILQRPTYTELANFVIDKANIEDVGQNISYEVGYANKTVTYYDRVDDFGVLSSNTTNVVQFDMALVNFVLDVDVDLSDFQSEYFLINANTVSLISDYAINYKNGWFHLFDGIMSKSDTDEQILNNNFISATHVNTFTGSNQITLSTYLTQEDLEGELYMKILGGSNNENEIRIPNLHFKPGHRAKLKLKVLRSGKARYDFEINYNKEPDINVNL